MDYQAVIFDFNGTLFFDNDKHVLAWGEISKVIRGYGINEAELYEKFNGTPNAKNIQYMMDGKATSDDINRYSLLKEEYYRMFCKADQSSFHLVKGVISYFNTLQELSIPFTIASASIKENIDFFIESFGLDKWIEPSSIVYDNGTYVNKIKMFKDAAKNLNCNIQDILVFEDSFSGINSAYLAGVNKIVVICSKEKEEEYRDLPGVIQVMQDFSCITDLLSNSNLYF